MAMLTCAECGNEASTSAKSCPHCGASRRAMRRRPRPPMGKWSKLGLLLMAIGFIAVAVMIQTMPKPTKTPQEIADERQEGTRLAIAVRAVKTLRALLRDPASLAFDKILVNETGDAACIRYRARNGFGGMNLEQFVMSDQGASSTAKGWNRRCAHRSLYDYTDTLPEMMKLTGQ